MYKLSFKAVLIAFAAVWLVSARAETQPSLFDWQTEIEFADGAPIADFTSATPALGRSQLLMQLGKELRGLSFDGQTQWRLDLGDFRDTNEIYDVSARNDGYFVTGSERIQGVIRFWLAFVDYDGNLRWRHFTPRSLAKLSTEQGRFWTCDGPNLYGTDSQGNVEAIELANLGVYQILALREVGSDLLIEAKTAFEDPGRLMRISRTGQLVWQKTVSDVSAAGVVYGSLNALSDRAVWMLKKKVGWTATGILLADGSALWSVENIDSVSEPEVHIDAAQAAYVLYEDSSSPRLVRINSAGAPSESVPFGGPIRFAGQTSTHLLLREQTTATSTTWRYLNKATLTAQWSRPSGLFQSGGIAHDGAIVLYQGLSDRFDRITFTDVNPATGDTNTTVERNFADRASNAGSVSGANYIYVVPQDMSSQRVDIYRKSDGSLRYSQSFAGFRAESTVLSGDDLILTGTTLTSSGSDVRVIRLRPESANPIFDVTHHFDYPLQSTLAATSDQIVLAADPICRPTLQCGGNPESRLIAIENATGAIVWSNLLSSSLNYPHSLTACGPTWILTNEINAQRKAVNAAGNTLWSTTGPAHDSNVYACDFAQNRLWIAQRRNNDTYLFSIDLTSGVVGAERQFNISISDEPQTLKLLSDGSLILRIKAYSAFSGSSAEVYIFRLQSDTFAIIWQQSSSSLQPTWRDFGQIFEERSDQLWLSGAPNFGYSPLHQAPYANASSTLVIDKNTGAIVGDYWWQFNPLAHALTGDDRLAPLAGEGDLATRMSFFNHSKNRLQRQQSFTSDQVDLRLNAISPPRFLGGSFILPVTLTNTGSATATQASLRHFHAADAQLNVELISCLPSCGPAMDGALTTVSLAPGQSVQITLRATVLYSKFDEGQTRSQYGLVIVPNRAQLELNSSDNAQLFDLIVGPFASGFEF